MQESLQSAHRVFYFLIFYCAALLALASGQRGTDRYDDALEELEDLRTHVFPLRDPANPTQLDPHRVPSPDCGEVLLHHPIWAELGLSPSRASPWYPHARPGDRSHPAREWTPREIRTAIERNAGGTCLLPDTRFIRETLSRLRAACGTCAAVPLARGDTLQLRWTTSRVANGYDTTLVVPENEVAQAGFGLNKVLTRAGKRSIPPLPALADIPAADTVPAEEAELVLKQLRAEASRVLAFAGLSMNERTALVGGPAGIVAILLYLAAKIGHIVRIHRTTDPGLVETFPWMVLSPNRAEAAIWRLLILVVPSVTAGSLVISVLRPDLDYPAHYVLSVAAASLSTMVASIVVLRRLDALDVAREHYRRSVTPLHRY